MIKQAKVFLQLISLNFTDPRTGTPIQPDNFSSLCYGIDDQIETIIDYYQRNPAGAKELKQAKEIASKLFALRNKYSLNVEDYNEIKEDYDFELSSTKKPLLENYVEIGEYFKIDATPPLNPFPKVFVNCEAYNAFMEYTKHIEPTDFYKSYSYLKKRLEAEKMIHKQMDTDFMFFVYKELELISKEQYTDYLHIGQLESAERTKGNGRKDRFELLCLK